MKKNKMVKILGIIFVVAALLIVIDFIPTLGLKTSNMHLIEGEWLYIYLMQNLFTKNIPIICIFQLFQK